MAWLRTARLLAGPVDADLVAACQEVAVCEVDASGVCNGDPESLAAMLTWPRAGTAVLTVSGEIDAFTAPTFETALAQLIAQPDQVLIAELIGVTFIASTGLSLLIQGANRVSDSDRALRLVIRDKPIPRLLKMTGTDELFDTYPNLESALGSA